MKFKYYLRGAGVGIIVTTIILTIAFFRYKPTLSANQIREEAKKLGMVEAGSVVNETPESNNQDSQKEEKKEEVTEPEKNDEKSSDSDNKDEKDSDSDKKEEESSAKDNKEDDKKEDEKSEDKKSEEKEEEEPRKIRFVVSGGEYSDVICNHLKEKGLIKNADRYNRWLGRNGYDNKIQPGVYFIKEGSTYREIAEILSEH